MEKSFGQKVRALRKKTGLTQAKFAVVIKVNRRTLEGWEIDRYLPDNEELLLIGIKYLVDEFLKGNK